MFQPLATRYFLPHPDHWTRAGTFESVNRVLIFLWIRAVVRYPIAPIRVFVQLQKRARRRLLEITARLIASFHLDAVQWDDSRRTHTARHRCLAILLFASFLVVGLLSGPFPTNGSDLSRRRLSSDQWMNSVSIIRFPLDYLTLYVQIRGEPAEDDCCTWGVPLLTTWK